MAPSKSPMSSVKLPIETRQYGEGMTANRAGDIKGQHTNLEPDLLIEGRNLLRGTQWGTLLRLRLQRDMAIDGSMSGEMRVMRGDTPRRRWLRMRHD